VEARWLVGRNIIARHRREHGSGTRATDASLRSPEPGERFEAAYRAALRAVDWAEGTGSLPLVLRAQAGARAALRQSLRRFREGVRRPDPQPTAEELEQLEQNYLAAVDAYEQASGRGPLELAALAGLRSALEQLKDATETVVAPMTMVVLTSDGIRIGESRGDSSSRRRPGRFPPQAGS
jgi:hypothetical protein